MPELIELLEPRRLMSVTAVAVHGAQLHRLDRPVSQVQIDARLVHTDLKHLRQFGVDFSSSLSTEVRHISTPLHPLSVANRALIDNALKAATDNRGQVLGAVAVVTREDQRAVAAVSRDYLLVLHRPTDSVARSELASALDNLSAISAPSGGLLDHVASAQQTIDGDLNAIAGQNIASIQALVSAAIASIDTKTEAIGTQSEQLLTDMDSLASAAEQAIE